MDLSQNELQSLCKSAARGAGWSWSIAEETGWAARWLARHGLPWGEAVLHLLQNTLAGQDEVLRTLSACDRFDRETGTLPTVSAVTTPVLILPHVAEVARRASSVLELSWDGQSAATDGTSVRIGEVKPILDRAVDVSVTLTSERVAPRPTQNRASIDKMVYDALTCLAARTLAPATEESRRLGAGAES